MQACEAERQYIQTMLSGTRRSMNWGIIFMSCCVVREERQKANGRLIIQHKWNYIKHINILEGNSFLTGILWLARQKQAFSAHVLMLIDSQVLYYLRMKGRSGVSRLW